MRGYTLLLMPWHASCNARLTPRENLPGTDTKETHIVQFCILQTLQSVQLYINVSTSRTHALAGYT
jgi:hypothetical protein